MFRVVRKCTLFLTLLPRTKGGIMKWWPNWVGMGIFWGTPTAVPSAYRNVCERPWQRIFTLSSLSNRYALHRPGPSQLANPQHVTHTSLPLRNNTTLHHAAVYVPVYVPVYVRNYRRSAGWLEVKGLSTQFRRLHAKAPTDSGKAIRRLHLCTVYVDMLTSSVLLTLYKSCNSCNRRKVNDCLRCFLMRFLMRFLRFPVCSATYAKSPAYCTHTDWTQKPSIIQKKRG